VEQLVFQPAPIVSGMVVFVYEDMTRRGAVGGAVSSAAATSAANHHRAWTVGARPQYHLNEYFKIAVEGGFQQVRPKAGDRSPQNLFKLTIAPTLSPELAPAGAFFARPDLRLFATWARWNGAAQRSGIAGQDTCSATGSSTSAFRCDTEGVTVGAQLETWW
jgi:maltoporin